MAITLIECGTEEKKWTEHLILRNSFSSLDFFTPIDWFIIYISRLVIFKYNTKNKLWRGITQLFVFQLKYAYSYIFFFSKWKFHRKMYTILIFGFKRRRKKSRWPLLETFFVAARMRKYLCRFDNLSTKHYVAICLFHLCRQQMKSRLKKRTKQSTFGQKVITDWMRWRDDVRLKTTFFVWNLTFDRSLAMESGKTHLVPFTLWLPENVISFDIIPIFMIDR